MPLKTWLQNHSLKHELENILTTSVPVRETPFWKAYQTEWEGVLTLIVYWGSDHHRGALAAEGLHALTEYLNERFGTEQMDRPAAILLVVASAGADVADPFASLAGINALLETLAVLTITQDITINGVLQGPLGTYGGASLLLASVCHTLWCTSPEDLHLMGRLKSDYTATA